MLKGQDLLSLFLSCSLTLCLPCVFFVFLFFPALDSILQILPRHSDSLCPCISPSLPLSCTHTCAHTGIMKDVYVCTRSDLFSLFSPSFVCLYTGKQRSLSSMYKIKMEQWSCFFIQSVCRDAALQLYPRDGNYIDIQILSSFQLSHSTDSHPHDRIIVPCCHCIRYYYKTDT